jgi:hypothetical protein
MYLEDIMKIDYERPLHTGSNRAYLAYIADVVIDMRNKITKICELKPHFTDTVIDILSQINNYEARLADEPLHNQNHPIYRNEFYIKNYDTIYAVILDTNTESDEFLKGQGVGRCIYHIVISP